MNLIDRTGPLWRGGLSIGPPTKPRAADLPPVTGPDTATAPAGGTVTSEVLDNDVNPEGGVLSLVEADADRGSVAVSPEGTLLYTAPADYSGIATITYTVVDPSGNARQGTVTVEVVDLTITGAEFAVSAAPGVLGITVSAPAEDAGEYVLKTAGSGRRPRGPGAATDLGVGGGRRDADRRLRALGLRCGRPLTAVTRQWLRDGAPITGETGASYTVTATDAEQTLSVAETAATQAGARKVTSAGAPVAAGPREGWTPAALPGLLVWLDASDPGALTHSGGEVIELADKSGNGRHVRKIPIPPAPTLGAVLGGKTTLRFPPGAVLKSSAGALPGLPGMPGLTVIAVTQAHQTDSRRKCMVLRNEQAAGGQQINLQTGCSVMWFGNGNRFWTAPPTGAVIAVARYPENGTHAGTEWWRNGTKLAPTSTSRGSNSVSLPADAYIQIGNDDGPTSEQAEFLIFLGPLGEADRQKAEGYLAHKWDLAGQLPAAHPFSAAPPVS